MIRARLRDMEARLARQGKLDQRDELTKQYFNGRATVDTGGKDFVLNGRVLSASDFIRLAGAPDGSAVRVSASADGLEITAAHPQIFQGGQAEFSLIRQAAGYGGLLLDETIMINPGQPEGLGLRLFAVQAHAAAAAGIDAIALEAAGSARSNMFNGYYTWPRYGFDVELNAAERTALPETLRTSTSVADLISSQEGRRWWRSHGSTRYMEFDLTVNSRSWETLQAVMKEKGVRL